MAVGLAVALVAALGGWAVAERIAADRPPAAPVAELLDAGPARLQVSSGWHGAPKPPALPGLGGSTGLDAVLGPGPRRSRSRWCRPTTRRWSPWPGQGGPGRAAATREGAGGRAARRARIAASRPATRVLDIYAIPTTRGVLTLVCAARNGAPEAPTWCLNGLDQITVTARGRCRLTDDTAYHMQAPAVLKALDASRVAGAQGAAPRQRPGRARAFRAQPLAGLQGRRRRARSRSPRPRAGRRRA